MSSTLLIQKPLGLPSSASNESKTSVGGFRSRAKASDDLCTRLRTERELQTITPTPATASGASLRTNIRFAGDSEPRRFSTCKPCYGSCQAGSEIQRDRHCGVSGARSTAMQPERIHAGAAGVRNLAKQPSNCFVEVSQVSPPSAWTDECKFNSSDSTDLAALSEASFSRPCSSTSAADFTEQELVQAGKLLRLLRRRIERDVRQRAGQIKSGDIQRNSFSYSQPPVQTYSAELAPERHVVRPRIVRSTGSATLNGKSSVAAPASGFQAGEVCTPIAISGVPNVSDSARRTRTISQEYQDAAHGHQQPAERTCSHVTDQSSASGREGGVMQRSKTAALQQNGKNAKVSISLSGETSFATLDSARDNASRHSYDLSVVEYSQALTDAKAKTECLPTSPFDRPLCSSSEASWCSAGSKEDTKAGRIDATAHTRSHCAVSCKPLPLSAIHKVGITAGVCVETESKKTEVQCVSEGREVPKVPSAPYRKTTFCARRKENVPGATQEEHSLSNNLAGDQGTSNPVEDDTALLEGDATHDDEQIEKCPDCNRTFKCSAFEKHAKICRKSEQFRAAMRMTRLSDPAKIAEAQAILAEFSEAAASYKCPHCSRTFGRSEALEKHERVCLRLFRSSAGGVKAGISSSASKVGARTGRRDSGPATPAGGICRTRSGPLRDEPRRFSLADGPCTRTEKNFRVTVPAVLSSSSSETPAAVPLSGVSEKPRDRRGIIHHPVERRLTLQRYATY